VTQKDISDMTAEDQHDMLWEECGVDEDAVLDQVRTAFQYLSRTDYRDKFVKGSAEHGTGWMSADVDLWQHIVDEVTDLVNYDMMQHYRLVNS
jgi:hypothetical protein